MTLVDTSVLLDVLLDGASHGDESAGRLRDAMKRGAVFVNDVVAAELAPVFPDEADLWATLERANVEHERYPRAAIHLAGQALVRYRRSGGSRSRILPDFLIAAHALVLGADLLTRDRGFYRSHFSDLRLSS